MKNTIFPSQATESKEGKKSCVFKFLFFDPPMVEEEDAGENESKSHTNKKAKKKKPKKSTTTTEEVDACLPLETVNGIDDVPVPSQISMERMCSVETDDIPVTKSGKKTNKQTTNNKKVSKGTKKSVADDDDDDIDIDAMVKELDAKAALATKMVATSSSHKTTTNNNTTTLGRTGIPKKKSDVKPPSPATFSFKSHKDPELTNEQKELMIRHRQRAIAAVPRRTTTVAPMVTAASTTSAIVSTSEPESVSPFSFGFSVS